MFYTLYVFRFSIFSISEADDPAKPPLRPQSDLENSKDLCPICRIKDDQISIIERDTCDQ